MQIDNAHLVSKGSVIALRNGRSEVVQEHIRLELDKFGKVTLEHVSLKMRELLID
jgi:hypothetical protein